LKVSAKRLKLKSRLCDHDFEEEEEAVKAYINVKGKKIYKDGTIPKII
jgi:hypothetical protein